MFNVGGGEILLILLLALLILGPEKLPDSARKVGRFMNDVRRMTSGFQEEVRSAMDITGMNDDPGKRTAAGPRLVSPPPVDEPSATPPAESPAPAASDSGPELVKPDAPDTGDTGDTSAA